MMLILYCLLSAALVEVAVSVEPTLHCLICRNVTSTTDKCFNATECMGECFKRTTTLADGHTRIDYGCTRRKQCGTTTGVVGRRSAGSVKTTYCKKEICNVDMDHFTPPSTSVCKDISASDCNDPEALKSICSDCGLSRYCEKSCGLCQPSHPGSWYENQVLLDFDFAHRTCRHSSSINSSICQSIKMQHYLTTPVVENNYTNQAHTSRDYLILTTPTSYVRMQFKTNGEPLLNMQIYACQSTGRGRVDILVNNQPIALSYKGTHIWNLNWQIHELTSHDFGTTTDYDVIIRKDTAAPSYGHYWIGRIRMETIKKHNQ